MAKCKTEGCVNEEALYTKVGSSRDGYCSKCIQEFRHLPEAERVKVLAARQAIDQLWDAIMSLDEQAQNYFIVLISENVMDECNPRDDHNIVWQ